MGKIVTIDFDNFTENIDEAYQCLIDFLPCKVRISGGGNGLHFKKYCFDESYKNAFVIREKYDDPKRLYVDRINERAGLTTNILLGHFCFKNETRIASEWITVRNKEDADLEFKNITERIKNGNGNYIKVR